MNGRPGTLSGSIRRTGDHEIEHTRSEYASVFNLRCRRGPVLYLHLARNRQRPDSLIQINCFESWFDGPLRMFWTTLLIYEVPLAVEIESTLKSDVTTPCRKLLLQIGEQGGSEFAREKLTISSRGEGFHQRHCPGWDSRHVIGKHPYTAICQAEESACAVIGPDPIERAAILIISGAVVAGIRTFSVLTRAVRFSIPDSRRDIVFCAAA